MMCTTGLQNYSSIVWVEFVKNGEHLIYCGPLLRSERMLDKFQISRTVSGCSLIIMDVTTEDAGSYSCNVYLPEQSSTGFVRATSNVFELNPVSLPPTTAETCLQTWGLAVGVVLFAVTIIAEAIIIGWLCYKYCRGRQREDNQQPPECQRLNGNHRDSNFITTLACTACTCTYIPDANAYRECKWECIINIYYLWNLKESFQALAELLQTKLHPELQFDSLCSQTNRLRDWLCDS